MVFKKFILIVLSSVLTHCHPVIAEEYPTHVFPNRLLKDILIEEGFEKLGSYHD